MRRRKNKPVWTCTLLFAVSMLAQESASVPTKRAMSLTYVTCYIGTSRPLSCLVDTGSRNTGVRDSLVSELGFKKLPDQAGPRYQGIASFEIRIGSVSWRAESTTTLPEDIEQLDKASGAHTDVLIGSDFFRKYQVTVESEKKTLKISQPGAPVDPTYERLNAAVPYGIGVVLVGVKPADNRMAAAPFVVDTGSMTPLIPSGSFWSEDDPRLGPTSASNPYKLSVRMGSVNVEDVRGVMPQSRSGVLAVKALGGILGAPVLNQLDVVYDYAKNVIWIRRSVSD